MSLVGLAALAGWAGVAILLLFWKSFLPAYLSKKAENFATHEDINKLVDQVQAVTTATEQIKARISNEVWDRQKQWELKREMIIEVCKAVSRIEETLIRVNSALAVRDEPESQEWMPTYRAAIMEWREASAFLDQARMLVDIACTVNTAKFVHEYAMFATTLCSKMTKDKDAKAYKDGSPELNVKYLTMIQALRRELGIADGPPPQSSTSV